MLLASRLAWRSASVGKIHTCASGSSSRNWSGSRASDMIPSSAAPYPGATVRQTHVLGEYLIVASQQQLFVLEVEMGFGARGDDRLRLLHRARVFHDQIAIGHACMFLAK